MGLDMFLISKHHIGNSNRTQDNKLKIVKHGKGLLSSEGIDNDTILEITCEAGYWRKANAIHAWFVRECQGGNDECQETYVEYEKLMQLLDLCKQVKENPDKASELLPTQEGFFFGSTEYGPWYFQDIENTIRIIESLNVDNFYYYHSSW